MLAGEARRQAGGLPRRYAMLDKQDKPRWHFVWDGNPHVSKPGEAHDGTIGYCQGRRPYVADVKPERYSFKQYEPAPAYLALGGRSPHFAKTAAGAVVFNPTIKTKASPNKNWGLEKWARLLELTPGVRWVQLWQPGDPRFKDIERLETVHFMDAAAALTRASLVVVHEGALHHAAAAVGTPAIVIRGGFISPQVTGYAGQVDFYVPDERWPLGCGFRVPCEHCREAMDKIAPEQVAEALLTLLKETKVAA